MLNGMVQNPHYLHMQITQIRPPLTDTRKYLKTETMNDLCHCSSVTKLNCHLTMSVHCILAILILVMTLDDQGMCCL